MFKCDKTKSHDIYYVVHARTYSQNNRTYSQNNPDMSSARVIDAIPNQKNEQIVQHSRAAWFVGRAA